MLLVRQFGLMRYRQLLNRYMISISFTLHPNRAQNLDAIYEAYESYDFVDEVLVVTGTEIKLNKPTKKFKFVHMPGPYTYGAWPSFGLLSRYTWALSCKNRYVFMQDDDFVYQESTLKKLYNMQSPLAGCHRRWFINGEYTKRSPNKKANTAPMVITGGVLVDTSYLPGVITYAKEFWKEEYQTVFNGEDVFMSRAISKLSGYEEFPFVKDKFISLPDYNSKLHMQVNTKTDRLNIVKSIYNFFSTTDQNS